jgi:hypothetical protein
MAPRSWNLPEPGQPNEEVDAMTIAHDAHPSTGDQDDTVDAHYASLERSHACYDGVVYIGRLVEVPGTGEEVEVIGAVPCRRCADSR